MKDLSPSSWATLTEQFLTNDDVFNTWWENFHTSVPNPPCTGSCRAV